MRPGDRIVAMDAGRVIAEGPPDIVRSNAQVVEAYLGGSIAAPAALGHELAERILAAGAAPLLERLRAG